MANIGRPTKYKPEYCEMIVEYFNSPLTTTTTETYTTKAGTVIEKKIDKPNLFPTFERFAFNIGVNCDTLVEWEKDFPDFSAAYMRAKMLQKNFLLQNTLPGHFDSRFAQFVAKNCCGMKDVVEVTGGDKPLLIIAGIRPGEGVDMGELSTEEHRLLKP